MKNINDFTFSLVSDDQNVSSAVLCSRPGYMFGFTPGSEPHLECAGAVLQEACCLQEQCSHFHWLEK